MSQCSKYICPRCWCTDTKLGLSWRLLLGDLTCLTYGYSVKSSRSRICQTCNQRHCYRDYRLPSSFFSLVRGHTVDRHWVTSASLQTPLHCSRLRWRPRTTWLRGIDVSVQSANTGIHFVWKKADDNTLWRWRIDTATLKYGHATENVGVGLSFALFSLWRNWLGTSTLHFVFSFQFISVTVL